MTVPAYDNNKSLANKYGIQGTSHYNSRSNWQCGANGNVDERWILDPDKTLSYNMILAPNTPWPECNSEHMTEPSLDKVVLIT